MHPYVLLSEPIRRRLVEILASGEHTAGELEGVITHEFGVGRSAVQHHLALLQRCGWTDTRPDWPHRWYHLNHGVVERIEREAHDLRERWDRRIGWNGEGRAQSELEPERKGKRGRGRDPDDMWARVLD